MRRAATFVLVACTACGGDELADAVLGPDELTEVVQRPPLAPLGDVGPNEPDDWSVHPPIDGASADTLTLRSAETGYTVEGAIVQASARTALMAYQGGGPYTDLVLRDTRVLVQPGLLELDRSYWGVRGYDAIDWRFERVEITGFGQVTHKHDEGHAVYLNVRGDLTFEGCDIHHNGGQAIQLVNRPYESVLERGPGEGTIALRRSKIRENGFNPDRAAFQVSIFGTGHDVAFTDVEITAGDGSVEFPGGRTGGALLIEAEGYQPNKPGRCWWRPDGDLPRGFGTPFTNGAVTLERVRVRHAQPNRALVQIKGCRELIVSDSEFVGGKVVLDDPSKPGRDCGRIEWRGNRGDATVWLRGKVLGPATRDFTIGE